MRGRSLAFGLLAAAAAATPALAQRSGGTGAAHAQNTGPHPSQARQDAAGGRQDPRGLDSPPAADNRTPATGTTPGTGGSAGAGANANPRPDTPGRDAGIGARDAATNTAAAIRADAGRDMVSRVSQLIGTPVRLQTGGNLGEIADIVLDQQGFAQYLVIAANNRYALVPFGMATVDLPRRMVTVGATAERLDLAAFDREEWANMSMPMLNQRMGRVYGEAIYPAGGTLGGAGAAAAGAASGATSLGDPQRQNPISPRTGTLGPDQTIAPGAAASPNASQARDGLRGDRNGGGDLPRSPGAVGDQIGGGRGLPGNIGPGVGSPGTGAGTGPGSGTGLGTGGTGGGTIPGGGVGTGGGGGVGGGTIPGGGSGGGIGGGGAGQPGSTTGGPNSGGGAGTGAGLGGGSSAGSF
jgi:sporulation protein YlmC with PRC-barrel domain